LIDALACIQHSNPSSFPSEQVGGELPERPESQMSGLEPLAVLSIACSAIQCLSFGHELISLFKRHFQSGSVDLGVADNATLLSRWSLELSGSLAYDQR
jgi:hypothetical protein